MMKEKRKKQRENSNHEHGQWKLKNHRRQLIPPECKKKEKEIK